MKKSILALIAACSVALVGCEDQGALNTIAAAEKLMNSNEKGMMADYIGFRFGDKMDYFPMYSGIVLSRKERLKESGTPFCDVYTQILVAENGIATDIKKPNMSLAPVTKQFEKIFGKPLSEVCFPKLKPTVDNTPPRLNVVETVNVVNVDDENVISPALYDELINSVGSCKRASIRVMELTDGNRLLTKKDYTEVNRIILNCKNALLNKKVNFD